MWCRRCIPRLPRWTRTCVIAHCQFRFLDDRQRQWRNGEMNRSANLSHVIRALLAYVSVLRVCQYLLCIFVHICVVCIYTLCVSVPSRRRLRDGGARVNNEAASLRETTKNVQIADSTSTINFYLYNTARRDVVTWTRIPRRNPTMTLQKQL